MDTLDKLLAQVENGSDPLEPPAELRGLLAAAAAGQRWADAVAAETAARFIAECPLGDEGEP